jgi:hypothetical protein
VKAISHGIWFTVALVDKARFTPEGRAANARFLAAAPELLKALKALYEHCAMVHKHWGAGSNQREADAAIAAGLAAIAKAEGVRA